MKDVFAQLRQEYVCQPLLESDMSADPLQEFRKWFGLAVDLEPFEANAMTLSTCDAQGRPSARVVLLKELDPRGFTFFTNYHSRKGQELQAQPWASLLFFWARQHRQVRVEGMVEKLTAEESDSYFTSRPRGSQLGAWVSEQSQPIASRQLIEQRRDQLEVEMTDSVRRPPHWGGYRLLPLSLEFWQGQPNRLHDRIHYQWDGTLWNRQRLQP